VKLSRNTLAATYYLAALTLISVLRSRHRHGFRPECGHLVPPEAEPRPDSL